MDQLRIGVVERDDVLWGLEFGLGSLGLLIGAIMRYGGGACEDEIYDRVLMWRFLVLVRWLGQLSVREFIGDAEV